MKLRTRQKVGLVLTAAGAVASLLWPLWGHSYADPLGTQQCELTAGEATAFATGRNAFSMPLPTLDDDERARFVSAGFRIVSLGSTVLRFETAAVAALGVARASLSLGAERTHG